MGGVISKIGHAIGLRGQGSTSKPTIAYASPYQQDYEQAARGPLLSAASGLSNLPLSQSYSQYLNSQPQQFRQPYQQAASQASNYYGSLQGPGGGSSFQFQTPKINFMEVPKLQGLGNDYYQNLMQQAQSPILRGQTSAMQALQRAGAGKGMGRSGILASQLANIARGTGEQLANVSRDTNLQRMTRDYDEAVRSRDLSAQLGVQQAGLEGQSQQQRAQYGLDLGRMLNEREQGLGGMSLQEQARLAQQLGGERDYQSQLLTQLFNYMRPVVGTQSETHAPGFLRETWNTALGGGR